MYEHNMLLHNIQCTACTSLRHGQKY